MNILFVASGNNSDGPGAVVANQAESLRRAGHNVDFYLVQGKGATGYLKNYLPLGKKIRSGKYHIVHAHGMSALLAGMISVRPVVASLLGSEVFEQRRLKKVWPFFIRKRWAAVIVKSERMADELARTSDDVIRQHLHIIPNGVDTERFRPSEKNEALKNLPDGFREKKPLVLFMADPERHSKNAALARDTMKLIPEAELKILHNVSVEQVPFYLNASEAVLLTSRWEGSPNIIKEAMACGRPIVSTEVGDVSWLLGNLDGHYIADAKPAALADAVRKALTFSGITKGPERIQELGLDDVSVARRITSVYESVINE